MKYVRWFAAMAAVALVVGSATSAAAQEKPWLLEFDIGWTVPIGEFKDSTDVEAWAGGVRVGYSIKPRWTLVGGFGTTFFQGKNQNPDWRVYSYNLQIQYEIPTTSEQIKVPVYLAAGAMTFDERNPDPNATESSGTYPAITGGGRIQWYISPTFALNFFGGLAVSFTKQEEVGTDTFIGIPVGVGVVFLF